MAQPRLQAPSVDEAEPSLSVVDVWNTVRRSRWIVAGIVVASLGLGALATWVQAPVYASSTTLLVREKQPGISLLAELGPLSGGGAGSGIETDMVVLQSWRIAEAVTDSLALHVELAKPRAPRSELLHVVRAEQVTERREYRLHRQSDGRYGTVADGGAPVVAAVGEPMHLGAATLVLRASPQEPPTEIVVVLRPFRRTVENLRRAMGVGRSSREVMVVNVTYHHTDPELAAAVPNVAAERFMRHRLGMDRQESQEMVRFLRGQVSDYEDQLRSAEQDLRAFREAERVVAPREEASEQVRRLAERSAEREAKGAERDALAALLARVAATPAEAGQSPYRQLASFPIFLANRLVQDLVQSITTLENRRADLLVQRTEEHPEVQGIDERIEQLEDQLYRTARGYLASLDSELTSIDAELARFGDVLQTIPARELEFARRLREQELLETLYTLLQTRLKEAEIGDAVETGSIRVVDPALVPERPVSPSPVRNMALAGMFGLLLGVGVAMGRQALDTRVHTEEDVVAISGGAPVLGSIPRFVGRGARWGRSDSGNGAAGGLVTRTDPRSPVSEAYRALRTNLAFAGIEGTPQVIVVTSAMPGDGKSTSAANLAVTLAQQGTSTLLVDGDLRRGELHQLVGGRSEPGLTHLLLGRASMDECLQALVVAEDAGHLGFVSAGVFPPNPAELLGSPKMRDLVAELRTRFDAIVVDAPPLNHVTDAAVLGSFADSTLLVARAGQTEKEALRHAVGRLELLRARVGGVVLNDTESGPAAYGYYGVEERAAPRNGSRRG